MNRRKIIALLSFLTILAWSAESIQLQKDGAGWRMLVDGKPLFLKGMTWSYCPVGFKYDYQIPVDQWEAVCRRDLVPMRAMGVNVLRGSRSPQSATQIFQTYGIRSIVTDFLGRYGMMVDGKWTFPTDYSNPRVRTLLKEQCRKLAQEYRDNPGVLAYCLGNENNYGLEWTSTEIENLPQGERHAARARHLYSLFEECVREIKAIDPNRPVGLTNGDLQYLSLIRELCPGIDFLGVNSYRGKTFTDLFDTAAKGLDKPLLITEMGCDAFNARTESEDQDSQAFYHVNQWQDLYRNAPGNGGAGNCIGGLVFQWADEWWKHGQQVRLDQHDTTASWNNGGYQFDFVPGKNNMNEEWFGLCALHQTRIDGVHRISPRLAVEALARVWSKDPFGLGADGLVSHFGVFQLFEKTAAAEKQRTAAKKADLPAIVYDEGEGRLWFPSGYMGNTGKVALDLNWADNPHAGRTCLKVSYGAPDNWAGVVWQHPANDWGEQEGGWNLSGARTLIFWARGAVGGEIVKFEAGILDAKAKFADTAKLSAGEITLTTEWKKYFIDLQGKDLSRIKTGFCWVVGNPGKPVSFFLDDIRYE